MMNRLFKSKRELIREIYALEIDKDNLIKTNKQLLHDINVIKIKNFNLKQEINKLQNGALDKNIVTDYENIIGSLKHENSYLRNEVAHLKFYEQAINEIDEDDIQQLIKVLAVKSMFKGE